MTKEEYYKDNEMYKYLKEHAYISYNKKSNYQFELAVDRAQCIANKYHNLTKDLQQNYERIYNENCKLRKEHNINDISLLDENYELQHKMDKAIEKLYLWGEILNPTFQKEMLEILGDKENDNNRE